MRTEAAFAAMLARAERAEAQRDDWKRRAEALEKAGGDLYEATRDAELCEDDDVQEARDAWAAALRAKERG